MQLPVLNSVTDVAARQLCCGCGACAAVSPRTLEMIDDVDHGRRPRVRAGATPPPPGAESVRVCPGIAIDHRYDARHPGLIRELMPAWGPVLEVWEGHAAENDVRFLGSSGGAATAVALSCLESQSMHGVLHIRARADAPILNETVLSTTRAELLEATGSRYAPASPCDGLGLVERSPGPCVFIGKPCDVAAVARTVPIRPALAGRIGVTIAMFCAGTPTTRGTMALLERVGVDDPRDVVSIRYRGRGWPGRAAIQVRTRLGLETRTLDYAEAWGDILTNHKQWRCQVCPDHTGELADIAVGDPWYRSPAPGESGRSLILVRTERGRRVLRRAVEHGFLNIRRADPSILPRSQAALLRTRGAVWGRLLACRLRRIPAPRFTGFPMFRFWVTALTWRERLRSLAGTVRRITRRGLHRPVLLRSMEDHDTPHVATPAAHASTPTPTPNPNPNATASPPAPASTRRAA